MLNYMCKVGLDIDEHYLPYMYGAWIKERKKDPQSLRKGKICQPLMHA